MGDRVHDGWSGEYDPEHFLDQVVRPLRLRPNLLPTDLSVRYAMPPMPPVPSAEWIAEHLRLVRADWAFRLEETPQGAVYQALLAADRVLSGDPDVDLYNPAWWAAYVPPPERLTEPVPAAPHPAPAAQPIPPAEPVVSEVSARPEPDPALLDAVPEPTELRIKASRIGGEVELRWNWPMGATHADVRWRERHVRVSRSEYKERGCWRHVMSPHRLEIEVVVHAGKSEKLTGMVVVDDRRQEVSYSVRWLWWRLGRRAYELTFTTEQPPVEFCLVEVGWSDADLVPLERDHLEMIGDPVPIGGSSVRHVVEVPAEARWLCCVLREAHTVDLVPPDVEQLRVRRWPR